VLLGKKYADIILKQKIETNEFVKKNQKKKSAKNRVKKH
jgi:hypothetical protein